MDQHPNDAPGRGACGGHAAARLRVLAGAALLLAAAGAAATDFAGAEAAQRALETAYFHEDLEAAVAARDFNYEARAQLASSHAAADADRVAQAALVLELSYRKRLKLEGFPDVRDRACALRGRTAVRADLVKLEQECTLADGSLRRETSYAAHTAAGWRIVELPQ